MAVPAEAQDAVDFLRQWGSASSTDVFDGVTYWSDDQLYEILQETVDYKTVYLTPVNKASTLFIHRLEKHYWLDETTIELDPTTSYTYDTNKRAFTFTATPTRYPQLYVQVWNMNHALAELWTQKAAQRFELIDVKGGSNQLFTQQEYEHCVTQAAKYRAREIRRFKR